LYLLGSPEIERISAMTFRGFPIAPDFPHPFDVEEHATVLVRAGEITFVLETGWTNHAVRGNTMLHLLGTEGALTALDTLSRQKEKNELEQVKLPPAEARNMYADFVQACQEGRDPLTPGEDGRKVMEIL